MLSGNPFSKAGGRTVKILDNKRILLELELEDSKPPNLEWAGFRTEF